MEGKSNMKIALFGKMRSGKDTVGQILTTEHGFKRFGFGDGIREIIEQYFPEAGAGGKPRKHYQHIGQELRELNPDVWINYLLRNVESCKLSNSICQTSSALKSGDWSRKPFNVVVTDGRQFNEATKLKEKGFLIVRVTTPEELRIERMKALGDVFTLEQLHHETELNVDLIQPDVELINDGSLQDLMVKVQQMLQDYRGYNLC